jgi:hypothetical protein
MSAKHSQAAQEDSYTFESQAPSRVSLLVASIQRRYPLAMALKFFHLFLIDILNIVFCALNHYKAGIVLHSVVTLVHVAVFTLDYLFRKWNIKKSRKTS